jgi:hypothetical protein
MSEKNLRAIEISALVLSIIVTLLAMLRAAAWSIDSGMLLFMLWAVSPYICFFFADIVLRKLLSLPKMPLIFCVISLLLLGSTLVTYIGTMNDRSSTYALIFLFVPIYLYIGSFILLGASIIFALLSKRSQS